MKKISFVLVFVIFVNFVEAQKEKMVLLKNGNSYFGVILSNENGKLKLLGHDLNTYVFDSSEINSISKQKAYRFPMERKVSGTIHDVSAQVTMIYYNFGNGNYDIYPYGIKLNYSFEKVMGKHSAGVEFSLFVNDDVAPTLGLKYRYEILSSPNTPFVQASFGNYADPWYNDGLGSRVGVGVGYQWGLRYYKRKYILLDFTQSNYKINTFQGRQFSYIQKMFSLGFGFRL